MFFVNISFETLSDRISETRVLANTLSEKTSGETQYSDFKAIHKELYRNTPVCQSSLWLTRDRKTQKTKGRTGVCVCVCGCGCRWKYQAIPCQFITEIMNDRLQLIVKAGCSLFRTNGAWVWTEIPRLYLIPWKYIRLGKFPSQFPFFFFLTGQMKVLNTEKRATCQNLTVLFTGDFSS